MMRGASGDECGKLLGQEYNRPAEAGVLKKPRKATLTLTLTFFYPTLDVPTFTASRLSRPQPARDPGSQSRQYVGEKWPINFA
jgi:hypothetical protein